MKKIYILSLMFCVLFASFVGCNKSSDNGETLTSTSEIIDTSENETTTNVEVTTPELTTEALPPLDTTMYINSSDVYLLAADIEGGYGYIVKHQTISSEERKFVSETAVKELNHTFLNKNYSLKYVESVKTSTNKNIDIYEYSDDETSGYIRFDSATKKMTKYSGMLYEFDAISEEDHISYCKKLLKDIVDLDEYTFSEVKTRMYFIHDNGMRATTLDGFYIPKNENERLVWREIYLNRKIKGKYVTGSVCVTIAENRNRMIIDISEGNIDEKDFDFNKIEAAEKSIAGIADMHLSNNCKLNSVELESMAISKRNGISYLTMNIKVYFSPLDSPDKQYDGVIQFFVNVTP